ncbi:MAG: hypothetical protein Q8P50_14635 [Bacillota bacterium]|nr:hypothetical protein [Bacillota bacterium]
MPRAIIQFTKCIQDSQDLGSDDEHMVSRVFFDLVSGETVFGDLYCDVKQSVGSSFETGTLEVSRPRGYDGSLDYAPFRDAVEAYYRRLIGSSGTGIRVVGASRVRMRNNTFVKPTQTHVEYSENSMGW